MPIFIDFAHEELEVEDLPAPAKASTRPTASTSTTAIEQTWDDDVTGRGVGGGGEMGA